MDTKPLIADLDAHISKLQAAKAALPSLDTENVKTDRSKRTRSAESRAWVAAALKKRWAAMKKAKASQRA